MKDVSFYSTFTLTSLLATVSWKLAENMTPGSETKEFITHSKQHELYTQGLDLSFPMGMCRAAQLNAA